MIRIDIKNFPAALDRYSEEVRRAQMKGLLSAAVATTSWIKRAIGAIKPHAPIDMGHYRAGWMFKRMPDGASVYNERMPIAAIIDGGVRPENVKAGKKMISSLVEWVIRKGLARSGPKAKKGKNKGKGTGLANLSIASSIAWAIAMKMKKNGIFMDDQFRITTRATIWLVTNIESYVTRELKKVPIK